MVLEGLALIERKTCFGDPMDVSARPDHTAEWWVLSVEGLGDFTQRQLMAMQFLWSLSKTCSEGMQCYSWLMGSADSQFEGDGAANMGKRIFDTWPLEGLPGFGDGFHLEWSHLYCARGKSWFQDNFIQAFAMTLSANYGNNTTIFLPPMKTPMPRKDMWIPARVLSLLAGCNDEAVFMPLNVNGTHWTCLVVDGPKATIYCYDSLDKRANHNLLADLANELVDKSLPENYTITAVHSPIQRDSDNCGLFICWRRFRKEVGNDYTAVGITRHRWDMLRTVVDFSDASKETNNE